MNSRIGSLALISALAIATAGCGGSGGSKDKPSAATVSAKPASGDNISGTGYTYTAPAGWHTPSKPIPGFDPDSIVFNTKDKDGFADNLNVLRVEAPVKDIDALEKGSVTELKGIHATDVKVLDRQTVDGETTVHLTSTLSQNGIDYHTEQFAMLHGKFEYAITFSASASVSRADQDALAQSVLTTWKWAS